jgi:hypothetical protein
MPARDAWADVAGGLWERAGLDGALERVGTHAEISGRSIRVHPGGPVILSPLPVNVESAPSRLTPTPAHGADRMVHSGAVVARVGRHRLHRLRDRSDLAAVAIPRANRPAGQGTPHRPGRSSDRRATDAGALPNLPGRPNAFPQAWTGNQVLPSDIASNVAPDRDDRTISALAWTPAAVVALSFFAWNKTRRIARSNACSR